MADPFFDLANLSAHHRFPPERNEALLRHYFGRIDDPLRATLSLMLLVSELREAMWGVVQLAVSSLEFDFAAYAAERGERVAALRAGLDLAELLSLAGSAS
jgi:hypothetical protein